MRKETCPKRFALDRFLPDDVEGCLLSNLCSPLVLTPAAYLIDNGKPSGFRELVGSGLDCTQSKTLFFPAGTTTRDTLHCRTTRLSDYVTTQLHLHRTAFGAVQVSHYRTKTLLKNLPV